VEIIKLAHGDENKMKAILILSLVGRLKQSYSATNKFIMLLVLITILVPSVVGLAKSKSKGGNPVVIMSTSMGDIKIELYPDKAPETVKNFLAYASDKFYDNTIFHRVIPGFMVQGGGFTQDMQQKPTKSPIKNEADNSLKNDAGTIAMARTNVVDSATSQFFINLVNNDFLNRGTRDFGYAVFGKVVEGMDIVRKIGGVKTGSKGPFQDVPAEPVIIKSVHMVEEGK
jgi:peptidyl-prolyl cis-trans isomerase A (cyclophilin A)